MTVSPKLLVKNNRKFLRLGGYFFVSVYVTRTTSATRDKSAMISIVDIFTTPLPWRDNRHHTAAQFYHTIR